MGGIRPPRHLLLAGLLLLLIASVGLGEISDPPEVVALAERVQAPVSQALSAVHATLAPEIDLSKLTRAKSHPTSLQLFAPRSFYTPPPPPPAPPVVVAKLAPPLPPPPPSAPPLPFRYMGRMTDDLTQPVFFLVKGDQLYNVKVGDVIEATYRIDSVAGSSLRLIYLPLDIAQLLPMGQS